MMRKGHDFRDYICPDSVEKHSDYLMLGGKYARVIYLKDYSRFRQILLCQAADCGHCLVYEG